MVQNLRLKLHITLYLKNDAYKKYFWGDLRSNSVELFNSERFFNWHSKIILFRVPSWLSLKDKQ